MFRDMKEDVYETLKEEVNTNSFETLTNIFEDLEGVGVDDDTLEDYYSRKLGSKYSDSDTGFARYVIDYISIASSLFRENDFKFSFGEYVRSIVFRSLEIFIVKNVDINESLKEVCTEEIVLFYLQDRGIELTEEEFFFILGYDETSDIKKFYCGVSNICSVEFESKNTDEADLTESNVDNEEDDFEALDDIEVEDVEEKESFDENGMEEENSEESDKKEEAEASFEELFGD